MSAVRMSAVQLVISVDGCQLLELRKHLTRLNCLLADNRGEILEKENEDNGIGGVNGNAAGKWHFVAPTRQKVNEGHSASMQGLQDCLVSSSSSTVHTALNVRKD